MIDGADTFATPLAEDPSLATATPTHGIAEYILFVDAAALQVLGPLLPDANLFALYWWLPVVVAALALPAWLTELGMRRDISIGVTMLILLSPSVAWWSMWPLQPLAWSALAGFLLIKATNRSANGSSKLLAFIGALAAGALIARTAVGSYLPWAVPLAAAILIPTIALITSRQSMRSFSPILGVAAAAAVTLMLMVLIENRGAIEAMLSTGYPGSRVFTGAIGSLGELFGAQHLGVLRFNPAITGGNQSELSSAYGILLVPAVFLLLAISTAAWRFRQTWATVGSLSAVLVVLLAWIATDIPPEIGESIPLLNRIAPSRLLQIIGLPITLLFGLALDRFSRFTGDRSPVFVVALGSAAAAFLISAWAGSTLIATSLPDLRLGHVWATSAILGIGLGVAIYWSDRQFALVPLVLGAASIVLLVNPIFASTGDLRTGRAAGIVRTQASLDDPSTRWSSDNLDTDALLMANAIPSLSGQQWTGPSEDAWRIVDPLGRYRDAWNRAASYVIVRMVPDLVQPEVEAVRNDIIEIRVDPCSPLLDEFRVGHVITSSQIPSPCLELTQEFEFGGSTRFLYERTDTMSWLTDHVTDPAS